MMTKQIIKKYDVKYMTHVFHYLGGKLTVAADKFDLHIILCTRGNTYKVLKQRGRLRASVPYAKACMGVTAVSLIL